jgi:mannose-6-phosphate isomerase
MIALPVRTVEKPWGRDTLPPPFAAPSTVHGGQRIGEIWFEPDPRLPNLLVKYLFTSEKLSVQVHPSDEHAPPGTRGKDECWLVLDAEPGANLGIGFRGEVDADTIRAAALDGSIEDLLDWHEARAGDFFYLPAGTVHAIGPGLTLIEIQQNSDTTYRLYDYGRPRELHLEQAIAVAHGGPHPANLRRHLHPRDNTALVEGPKFQLQQVSGAPPGEVLRRFAGTVLVIPVEGSVTIGGEDFATGTCIQVEDLGEVAFPDDGRALIAQPLGS